MSGVASSIWMGDWSFVGPVASVPLSIGNSSNVFLTRILPVSHLVSLCCSSTFGREFEAALSRLASETLPSKTARTVFLINQWATVWGTAVERRVHPEDAAPFEAQLKAQVRERCYC